MILSVLRFQKKLNFLEAIDGILSFVDQKHFFSFSVENELYTICSHLFLEKARGITVFAW
jgi:hypothetical protein